MTISTLRQSLSSRLQGFVWDQWAQMGVSAPPLRLDRWAIDPEALLLLTLEVGRDEPRLLDEVLDWVVVNERLLSIQRLRNLARDEVDRQLVEAAVGWVGQWRRRPRLQSRPASAEAATENPVPYFRAATAPISMPDEAFLGAGLLKPKTAPSHKSQPPDPDAPVNFAFRTRGLLGVSVRAEIARVLVCGESEFSVQELSELTAYSKRNVQEALTALRSAGVVTASPVANEQRFAAPRERWAGLFGIEPSALPQLVDWPNLLHAFRVLLRWLADPENEDLSDYMRASEARSLVTEIEPGLRAAGVETDARAPDGDAYWDYFEGLVESASSALG